MSIKVGFNDLLLTVPVVRMADALALAREARAEQQLTFVVDSTEHVELLEAAAREVGVGLQVCIELDLMELKCESLKPPELVKESEAFEDPAGAGTRACTGRVGTSTASPSAPRRAP